MANTQWLRGPGGEVLGRIEEAGDQFWGFDKLGNPVGTFNPRADMTYDKNLRK
jgi:hypothetical protein